MPSVDTVKLTDFPEAPRIDMPTESLIISRVV